MNRVIVLLVSCGFLASAAVVRAAEGEPGPDAGARKPVRLDLYGDPLPDGVVARLGTPRLCYGESWLAFSPDACLLAIGNPHGGVHLCEVSTGKELWRADTPSGGSFIPSWPPLAFSPDGKVLAFCWSEQNAALAQHGPKGTIWLWDVSTGRELHKLPSAVEPITLAFDPGGRSLAVGGDRDPIQVWDTAEGKSLGRPVDLAGVIGLVFAPDGKMLTALSHGPRGGQEPVLSVWDLATGRERNPSTRLTRASYNGALGPDGRCFAAPTEDGKSIRLLDPATGKERCRTEGETSGPSKIAFSGDGQLLTAAGRDGMVRVWETTSGKLVHQFRALSAGVESVALSRDGKLLALAGRMDLGVHLWDVARERELHAFPGHRHGPLAAAFLPDGRTVATINRDHFQSSPVRQWGDWSLCRWDAASGKELARTRTDPGGEVRLTAFSPDGRLAVTVVHDGTLRLWDVAAGKELRHWQVPILEQTVRGPPQVIKELRLAISEPAFSPDGRVSLAPHGTTISCWEVATGKELPAFRVPGMVDSARCWASPDGRTLLLTGWEPPPSTPVGARPRAPRRRLRFLDATSGHVLREIVVEGNISLLCAFAPDGKTLAAAERSVLRLWEVASGQERGRLQTPGRFVTGLAFSPDSRVLAVAGRVPRWLQLWNPASGRLVGRLDRPADRAEDNCLAFSPDGTRLVVAGGDNTAPVYDVAAVARGPAPAAAKLTAGELEDLWIDLTGTDGPRAYRAIDRLAASPSESVPFLKGRFKRPAEVDERRLARLVADLDADDFAVREKATRELEGLGAQAEAALRQALEGKPSPEVRTRAERLLAKLKSGKLPPSPELVGLRVLEALEHSYSPLARQALTELAADKPESRLAQEAKAALQRLARRGATTP
jgi:WD40 repeat protein